MTLQSFEAVVRALNEAGVRYLIAGGLAVNAHGYLRFTHDVDLIVQLIPENVASAFRALTALGYHPLVPVDARDFADVEIREKWIREKGMTVLSFHSEIHREMPVDVFVDYPFDFNVEFDRSLQGEVLPGLQAQFVSIETLIEMKRAADRPRDHDDIRHLQWILEEGKQQRD
jgi:predicted nucleotidyltransferase